MNQTESCNGKVCLVVESVHGLTVINIIMF